MSNKVGRNSKFTPETREKLVNLIRVGNTDRDAYAQANIGASTFYLWLEIGEAVRDGKEHLGMPKDKEQQQAHLEFLENVIRARSEANAVAVLAFRTGLRPSEILEETLDTFSETRIDGNGNPYQYTRETKRVTTRKLPADWRAGEAWVKRRDPDNWSDKQDIRSHPTSTSWEDVMRTLKDEDEGADPFK